jgi:hypothetical protein
MVLAITYAFLRFPLPISYDRAFNITSSPQFIIDSNWLKISSFFFKSMASHMATFYEPQVTQVNEKSTPDSSLNLTLTQHFRDEEP